MRDKRPLWDQWFEWLFILAAVITLAPFVTATWAGIRCYAYHDRTACELLVLTNVQKASDLPWLNQPK